MIKIELKDNGEASVETQGRAGVLLQQAVSSIVAVLNQLSCYDYALAQMAYKAMRNIMSMPLDELLKAGEEGRRATREQERTRN